MLASIKGFATGVLATMAVVFGAAAFLGAGTKTNPPRTLGESCKDLQLIAKGSPAALGMYVESEAAALKMDADFYLKWCKRLDK